MALEAAVSIPHAAFRHAAVPVAPAEGLLTACVAKAVCQRVRSSSS